MLSKNAVFARETWEQVWACSPRFGLLRRNRVSGWFSYGLVSR
ncbi:MAG: hypothetical protein WC178_01800 [Candidatus Paceibacterota bacterium]